MFDIQEKIEVHFHIHSTRIRVGLSITCWLSIAAKMYSVSQPPPLKFSAIFPKRLGIFSPNFTRLLHVPIYAGLQFFYSVTCNFDEVMPY